MPERPGSAEPALDHLVRALTTTGHPHELARRDAALTMFREASATRRRAAFLPAFLTGWLTGWLTVWSRPSGRSGPSGGRYRPRPAGSVLPGRLATVGLAGLLALAGVTAAAYAQALPAPVQQIAYRVLAPLGVPNTPPQPASTGSAHHAGTPGASPLPSTVAASGTHGGTSSPSAPATPTTGGKQAGGYALTLGAARASVPSGGFDVFTGYLTRHGKAAGGIRVRWLERPAGATGWQLAAAGSTGPRGGVWFSLTHLTRTATFRLAGPDGARSAPVTVRVTLRLAVALAKVLGQTTDQLIATAPDGQPGDVVRLAELRSGAWTPVATAPLGPAQTATFSLPASSDGGHFYRAVLLKTGAHPVERSVPVWLPRHRTGAKVLGTPAPSPTTSGTPQPTTSPSPSLSPSPPPPSPTATTPAPTPAPTSSTHRHRHRG
jgi:hypothetical protein